MHRAGPRHPESPEMLQRKFEALQREMANA
jgi:hypothetical protein